MSIFNHILCSWAHFDGNIYSNNDYHHIKMWLVQVMTGCSTEISGPWCLTRVSGIHRSDQNWWGSVNYRVSGPLFHNPELGGDPPRQRP